MKILAALMIALALFSVWSLVKHRGDEKGRYAIPYLLLVLDGIVEARALMTADVRWDN